METWIKTSRTAPETGEHDGGRAKECTRRILDEPDLTRQDALMRCSDQLVQGTVVLVLPLVYSRWAVAVGKQPVVLSPWNIMNVLSVLQL